MLLLKIDTNNGRAVDGGFRHTIFETSKVNGKITINIVDSTKFTDVLCVEHIEQYRTNPAAFIESLNAQETEHDDTQK